MKRAVYNFFDNFRIFYHGPLEAYDIFLYSALSIGVVAMVAIVIGLIIFASILMPPFLYLMIGIGVFYFVCWLVARWLRT